MFIFHFSLQIFLNDINEIANDENNQSWAITLFLSLWQNIVGYVVLLRKECSTTQLEIKTFREQTILKNKSITLA